MGVLMQAQGWCVGAVERARVIRLRVVARRSIM